MSASRRVSLALVALLVVTLAAMLAQRPTAAAELAVRESSATADFPSRLSFRLLADAPQPVVAVEARYRPAFSPITFVARPQFGGGQRVDVTAGVDLRTNYFPPGIDFSYYWRLTLRDGSHLETPEQTFFLMDQRHDWIRLTEGQVTLFYYAGNPSFGREALDITLRSIERLKSRFGITADEPVRVVIYGSNRDFADALPPNSSEWIGGFADPGLHIIVTGIQPGTGSSNELKRVLSHEVVHLIVHQATTNPFNDPPPWLDEGLASYLQEVDDTRLSRAVQDAVRNGRLIPIRALNSSFPDDPSLALLSYAESESIVQFILEEKGEAKMAALIQIFQEGVSNDEAVQRTLGISIDQLDAEWKRWLGYKGDRLATSATTASPNDTNSGGTSPGVTDPLADLLPYAAAALIALTATVWLIRRAVLVRHTS